MTLYIAGELDGVPDRYRNRRNLRSSFTFDVRKDFPNLSNMKGAFDYLKTRFGSVFIISHLDTIKDFMDYLLPITIKKGYSNIVYS